MIFFLTPKSDSPSGGIWFLGRLAGMLVPDACVAQTESFGVWWDAHPEKQAPTFSRNLEPKDGDALVVPEVLFDAFRNPFLFPHSRKIMFLQSETWLDKRFDLRGIEAWTCSRYLCNYLKRVHGISSRKITPFVDDDVWHSVEKHDRQVLVMARRNAYYEDMIHRLEQENWPFVAIDKPISQRELAGYLAESDYYVHLTHPEGFPELCLEATRSKAVVVGTTGGGGVEFMFDKQTAWVIQDPHSGHYDDGAVFVDRVMAGLNYLQSDLARKEKIRTQAFDWSLRYTEEQTRKELLEALG